MFDKNQLPIIQSDISAISEVHGEEVAENVRFATQMIRVNGGVSPNTVKAVFPEGIDRRMDVEALFRVVANLAVWTEVE